MTTSRSGTEVWGDSGQALVEFLMGAGLIAITVSGIGWLFHAEWDKAHCAYLVFQTAHGQLIGEVQPGSGLHVVVRESPREVTGEGHCGASNETVALPKLEAMP